MNNHATSYLFPLHRFELHAQAAVPEVMSRLQAVTELKWPWLRRPKNKEFIGSVSQDRFRLLPIIQGRNTYLPWVLGSVTPSPSGGSRITMVLTLHPIASVAMVAFATLALQPSMSPPQGRWIPIALLTVFHFGMCAYGFVPGAKTIETRFRELLPAA